MGVLRGNAIVGQSGGPTAAINATLAGVLRGAHGAIEAGIIDRVYGMKNGVEGLLREDITDLSALAACEEDLCLLETTPAAALGSCRCKLEKPAPGGVYDRLFSILARYNIRYFFYIGGNDSMDTVEKLSAYAGEIGYELRVVGVPKTIDNDLPVTDHAPGFGSAAKFVATVVQEFLRDIAVYTVPAVTVVEIMGRDAGWLTAASSLPTLCGGVGPDLIYLPECAFDTERFVSDVRAALDRHPNVLVCVSEGIRFADGGYVGAGAQSGAVDVFGHKYLAGAAKVLEGVVRHRIGCKVRSVELNIAQRCAGHLLSRTDIEESRAVGQAAVSYAIDGKSGVMVTLQRAQQAGEYRCTVGCADISAIANREKTVPRSYINAAGNGVTQECIEYLAPLIAGEIFPPFAAGLPRHLIVE